MFDDDDGEKHLQLVERERIRVLGEQVAVVVRGAPQQAIKISALTQVFTHYYGYSLKPLQYGSDSLVDLIRKLRNHVKVEYHSLFSVFDGPETFYLLEQGFLTVCGLSTHVLMPS